jgi:hypothetical protein
MGVFDDIGVFFSKTVPNVVTKEIPKFFTQTIPSAFEKETYAPDLPPLRTEVANLEKSVERAREAFFSEQAALTTANNHYIELSEDFDNHVPSDLAEQTRARLIDAGQIATEMSNAEKTLRDVYKVTRTITTVATLGLAELGYLHADIKEERKALKHRRNVLKAMIRRYTPATEQLRKSRQTLEAETAKLKAALAEAGIEPGASAVSEKHASEGEAAARREMAARLLGGGVAPADVAELTGLSPEEVAGISPSSLTAADLAEPDDLTPEEAELLDHAKSGGA